MRQIFSNNLSCLYRSNDVIRYVSDDERNGAPCVRNVFQTRFLEDPSPACASRLAVLGASGGWGASGASGGWGGGGGKGR